MIEVIIVRGSNPSDVVEAINQIQNRSAKAISGSISKPSKLETAKKARRTDEEFYKWSRQVAKMFRAGKSVKQIAIDTGYGPKNVYRALSRQGVKLR